MFPDPPDETIQVRPDEKLDEVRLAEYLRGKLDGTNDEMSVRQFGGGAANLTYLLTFGESEYVLRRPPLGPVAKSAHDMQREYTVLSRLYQVFPYAPRAFLYCDDPSVIGSDFFIMERRHGTVIRRSVPPQFQQIPDAPHLMSRALVDALADFHAVDYAAIGLEDLGKPEGFIERQIEGWYRRWHKAKTTDNPEFEQVYQWLNEHLPPASKATLVHNDYKLDNTMLDSNDPAKIVAIFDWDMCTLGDPLNDLGALLCYWSEPDDPPFLQAISSMPVGDLGFMSRAELVQRYAEQSGRDVTNIQFYHALGLYRLTVIVAQIYIRYARGQTKDERFAALGQMIEPMAYAALLVARGEF